MMPLPWLMVFFVIFSCFYSVKFYVSSFSFFSVSNPLGVESSSVVFPW